MRGRKTTSELRMPSDMEGGKYEKCIGCDDNKPSGWCRQYRRWCHLVKDKCKRR